MLIPSRESDGTPEDILRENLSFLIRATLIERNLPQADAAKLLGVHQSQVSTLISGAHHMMVGRLFNYARKLEINVAVTFNVQNNCSRVFREQEIDLLKKHSALIATRPLTEISSEERMTLPNPHEQKSYG